MWGEECRVQGVHKDAADRRGVPPCALAGLSAGGVEVACDLTQRSTGKELIEDHSDVPSLVLVDYVPRPGLVAVGGGDPPVAVGSLPRRRMPSDAALACIAGIALGLELHLILCNQDE